MIVTEIRRLNVISMLKSWIVLYCSDDVSCWSSVAHVLHSASDWNLPGTCQSSVLIKFSHQSSVLVYSTDCCYFFRLRRSRSDIKHFHILLLFCLHLLMPFGCCDLMTLLMFVSRENTTVVEWINLDCPANIQSRKHTLFFATIHWRSRRGLSVCVFFSKVVIFKALVDF